jgi:hypothetical protein
MQRIFGVFLAVFACAAVGAGSAQAAEPFKPRLPDLVRGNDGIARALEAGRISEAQYALERVRAIAEPIRARLVFGEVETPQRLEATMILRDLVARIDQLSPAERAVARRLLARPTSASDSIRRYRTAARNRCGPRICVFWVERTSDAPSPKDKNRNGIPDWVDLTRKVAAYTWDVEVGRMGYRAPKSDIKSTNHGPNGKLDVYVADVGAIGLYGYCTTDDPSRGPRGDISAYCVVDDDFARSQFNGAAYGGRALRVTVAHEFFHAIQYGYDFLEDLWLMEGTAVWMEDEVFDTVNDNRQYLKVGPLATQFAWLPLDHENPDFSETDSSYHYGVWIFWRYLSERFSPGIIRKIWKRADSRPGALDEYSAQATVRALQSGGANFGSVLADLGYKNLHPGAFYSEGSKYPKPGPIASTPVTNAGVALSPVPVAHLSNSYYDFTPSGVSPTSTLTFTLSLPADPVISRASAAVTGAGGAVTKIAAVPSGPNWTITVPNFGGVQKVTLVLTNASARYECWVDGLYSCRGNPLDDVDFAFFATVS